MFGLSKSLIIGAVAAVIVSSLGSGALVYRYVHAQWDAERAAASVKALEETRRIEAERRAEAEARDNRIRTLETEHEAERSKNAAAAADADRSWAERLRRIAASCNRPRLPAAAANPSGVPDAVAGERDRRLEEFRRRLVAIGTGYNELALRDKLCVKTWAEVGR